MTNTDETKTTPLLEQEQTTEQSNFNLDYLIELVKNQAISGKVVDSIISFWQEKLKNKKDALYENFLEYFLFHASINTGFAYAFIYDPHKSQLLYEFGISPDNNIVDTIDGAPNLEYMKDINVHLDELEFKLFIERVEFNGQSFFIGVIPLDPKNRSALQTVKKIYSIYLSMYHCYYDLRLNNLYEKLIDNMSAEIAKCRKPEFPIVFLHLQFESFSKYINFAGDYFGYDLIMQIENELKNITSNEAVIYAVKPHEYILLFVDNLKTEVEPMFGRSMNVKNLLLNYHTRIYATSKIKLDMSDIWNKITKGI